ncbi:MAG: dipeptidase [Pirellulales bacterium]|nr:dipeptidase [Pirellulales bacterium]
MATIDQYLETHAQRFEQELFDLLRIPSISADTTRKADLRRAAEALAGHFRRIGLAVEIIEGDGPALVYAQSPRQEGLPTVLVYGHYDVQPVEPLDKWTTPPFEPTVRDGKVFARGAADDKGQLLTHVKSAEAWMAVEGRLPVNLKFILEGEEEVGSSYLAKFIGENREKLACDCIVISDGNQFAPGQPAITCGLRGIACFELILKGPNRDLHSGSFGGTVTNPANALARILAALIDADGVIQLPGFHDDVLPLSPAEREQLAGLPFDEDHYMRDLGLTALAGERGFTTLERRWARPTFDVCGLTSGYQGEGAKTIIPAVASAKLSFRLVPRQDPHKIGPALREKLAEVCPPGIAMELVDMHGTAAVHLSQDNPFMQAAAKALEHAFGAPPVFTREGGSIPIVSKFAQGLGVDALLLGWGQDDDNAHSPNEKFSLSDFHRAIRASVRLWEEFGRLAGA